MSKFKRPSGFDNGHRDDPEEQYRAGFQHGAAALLKAMQSENPPTWATIEKWIGTDLQRWRHDQQESPEPPKP